ncbi:hypothetical protein [Spirosoma arcticum]
MNPTAIEAKLLKALYEAPEMSGEIVVLLQKKGIDFSLDQAHAMGKKLHRRGYVKYEGSNMFTDVTLIGRGVEYVKNGSKKSAE